MDVNTVADLPPDRRRALFHRDAGIDAIASDVADIIERVREEGDRRAA